jgi:transcriptional regulator with XRE-family HTH domain
MRKLQDKIYNRLLKKTNVRKKSFLWESVYAFSGGTMESDFNLARFGERLREVRTRRNLTLKDVSQATKISIPTLSRVERGEAKEIESKTLFVLSAWANLNLDVFKDKANVQKSSTLDKVEIFLRADKNLEPKTADLLVKMFRMAYEQASSEK